MLKCAKVVALAVFAAGAMSSRTTAVTFDENISRNLTLSPELASAKPLAYLGLGKTTAAVPAFADHDHDNGNDHDHEHTLASTGPTREGKFEV